jgi:cysteine synthase A
MKVVNSILELIGETPLLNLERIAKGIDANVYCKLEFFNPTGSLKDRIALYMIEQAEKNGMLRPGHTIVEASTGNTGISLSFAGTMKGYKVKIYETIPGSAGEEKIKTMENFGAEVVVLKTDDVKKLEGKSVPGAEIELPGRRICLDLERKNHDIWWARQFSNPGNVKAHNETGREILSQLDNKVDVFVASIGTGGTLMGIAEALKNELPNVKVVGVQPGNSKFWITPGQPYPRSEIQGGIIADMLENEGLIDEVVSVSDADAVGMMHRLWREEGVFAGASSGANVLVSLKEAKRLSSGSVVTVFPDSGNRYLTEEHYVT